MPLIQASIQAQWQQQAALNFRLVQYQQLLHHLAVVAEQIQRHMATIDAQRVAQSMLPLGLEHVTPALRAP